MKRHLAALLLLVSGLMVVVAPIATLAATGHALCGQAMAGGAADDHAEQGAMHAGHGQTGAVYSEVMTFQDATDRQDTPVPLALGCCDHACISELPILMTQSDGARISSGIRHAWTSGDLTELSQPEGLRRPPKV